MPHHKRKGPKSTRAGCLFCKPHKRQGASVKDRQTHGQTRKIRVASEKIKEAVRG